MIIGARLQECSNLSLEELESLLSEKIAESESSPSVTSVPAPASAYFSPRQFSPKQSSFIASATVSPSAARHSMPTLKTKTTSPFIQKIDPSIFSAWPVAKQHKYVRLVKDFRNTALRMLQMTATTLIQMLILLSRSDLPILLFMRFSSFSPTVLAQGVICWKRGARGGGRSVQEVEPAPVSV